MTPGQIPVDAVLQTPYPASFADSGIEGEAAIANHLHDHVDHVSIRQQSQQLAGEAAGAIRCHRLL